MSVENTETAARIRPVDPHQPVGGAVIDAQGREIPITENMIRTACRELEKQQAAQQARQ